MTLSNTACPHKGCLPKVYLTILHLLYRRFFQWGTIWQPRQLDLEYDKKLWITIRGPPEVSLIIFDPVSDLKSWSQLNSSPTRLTEELRDSSHSHL